MRLRFSRLFLGLYIFEYFFAGKFGIKRYKQEELKSKEMDKKSEVKKTALKKVTELKKLLLKDFKDPSDGEE